MKEGIFGRNNNNNVFYWYLNQENQQNGSSSQAQMSNFEETCNLDCVCLF